MERYTTVIRGDELSHQVAKDIDEKLQGRFVRDDTNPDLVISIGGDGTILDAVHKYIDGQCSFVGVHTGTLGFFTDYRVNEVDLLIEDIYNGEGSINKRYLLEVDVVTANSTETFYALNEMRTDHGFYSQAIDISINGDFLEVFRGNGICVSTNSGSTAYNKSLGGAVIYPGIQVMQLTEVAAISHNAYHSLGSPLILDSANEISLISKNFNPLYLGMDHIFHVIDDVLEVKVRVSQRYVKFIEYRERSFIKRIARAFIHS